MKTKRLVVLAVLALLAPAAAAQVFKWVDESGRTHYGEKPPPGVKATEVGVPPPPSGAAAPPPPSWKDKELEMKRQRIERDQREDQSRQREAAEKQKAEARKNDCENARSYLENLERGVRYYNRDAKGERVFMEEQERAAAIETAKKRIRERCD